MANEFHIQGKRISVHSDGEVFVDGRATQIFQWQSDPQRWSNHARQEIRDLRGMSLEEVLKYKGFLRR